MQPLSLGGFSFDPMEPLATAGPAGTTTPSAPPPTTGETLDLGGAAPLSPQGPGALRAGATPDPASLPSPRPWPPASENLPRAAAWAALSSRGPADLAAGLLQQGSLGVALLPTLEEHARKAPGQPRGDWDARATPNGWDVPRNPSRTPVRPRGAFDVVEGTDDLGPLHVVPSTGGRIRALRLQWPEEYQEPAYAAQREVFHDVLTRLAPDVTVHVVAEGRSAAHLQALLAEWRIPRPERVHIHAMQLHSTPEQLYHPLTVWARDGAILMQAEDGRHVLLLPSSFRGDTKVSPSLNRLVVQGTGAAPALLGTVLPELVVRRSRLAFEGGDVVSSRRTVLLGSHTVATSMATLRLPREAVVDRFAQELGRDVLVIDPQPDFHVDLGFTFLDDDTIAVADPRGTERIAAGLSAEVDQMIAFTRGQGLADRYDAAATMLEARGFHVVRTPNLAGVGLSTPYLTYNNVLMERYLDGPHAVQRVFMPVYGVPALDEAARSVYRQHGYAVVDMPSARASTLLWGAIRCATGELHVTG